MRKWLIVLSLFLTGANAATVWTWVDDAGTVHYSDTPVPGARQIEITDSARVTTVPAGPSFSATPAPSRGAPGQGQGRVSRALRVLQPADQETLWNIGGMLEVQVELEPPLARGHTLDAVLDGQRRNLNATTTTFAVPDVFRGTHTLQVVLLDQTGVELLRSDPVSFVVQQTSIQNPNNPNARPRP